MSTPVMIGLIGLLLFLLLLPFVLLIATGIAVRLRVRRGDIKPEAGEN